MPLLNISLQEGFQNDLVIIRINGREVLQRDQVSTKLLLGYADSVAMEVPAGNLQVEIILPQRNLSATIPLQLRAATYLSVSIAAGQIDYFVSAVPFGFM